MKSHLLRPALRPVAGGLLSASLLCNAVHAAEAFSPNSKWMLGDWGGKRTELLAIKTVNALSHYTDWTIGHVHAGALGWVAMVSIGSLYHLIPKVFGREKMYSLGLINAHFWLATIGTVLYIASMWVNGITQGLMWRAVNEDGTLTYSFVEALAAGHPGFIVRMLGGFIFLLGMFLMAYNTWRTVSAAKPAEYEAAAQIA